MYSYIFRGLVLVALAALSFFGAYACGGGDDSVPPPEPTLFSVDTIKDFYVSGLSFTEYTSEKGAEEIEIYIQDLETNEAILCAGALNGLSQVEHDTENSSLDVNFMSVDDLNLLELKRFKIYLVERDNGQCPNGDAILDETTTILGESSELTLQDLQGDTLHIAMTKNSSIDLAKRGTVPSAVAVSELLGITVNSIKINSLDDDEVSAPEIEVHLFDVVKNQSVACASLDDVNEEGTEYTGLRKAFTKATLVENEDTVTWLRVFIIDRDTDGSCPEGFDPDQDNVIGVGGVSSYDDLFPADPMNMFFDKATISLVSPDAV